MQSTFLRGLFKILVVSFSIGLSGTFASAQPKAPLRLLTSAAELQQQLNAAGLRILDVRSTEAFESGHIPGAVRLDLAAWTAQSKSVAGLTDQAFWAQAVGELGIDAQTQAVVYGADAASAARAWWLLRFVGVKRASLLDGGWQAWQRAGGQVSKDAGQIASRKFVPAFQRERLLALPDLVKALDDSRTKVQIVDNRARGEYTGELTRGSRPGRVPGAVHVDWADLLDQNGCFKQPAELKALFAKRGLTPDSPVVTYCYSGGRASVGAIAFELAGYPRVQNYYCSWQEWSANDKAPVQLGP